MPRPFDAAALAEQVADGAQSAAFLRALFERRCTPFALDDGTLSRWLTLASAPNTVVLVALHHGNFPSLEYLAEVLRGRGRPTAAIYLQSDPPADTFDATLGCNGSLATLTDVIARLPARAIYLQAHGRWAFLSQLLATVHPGLRVVQEVWDWIDAYVDPANEQPFVDAGLFAPDELTMIRSAERRVRTSTAAFVQKHGGAVAEAIVADASVPELRIFPAPPRAWMHAPVARVPGPWRCVYAGQLKPSDTSRAAFGFLHYLPMIHALVEQSIAVTAYGGAGGIYEEYERAAQRMDGFTYHQRIEVRALVEALHGQQDFGLILYDFDDELVVGRRHLQCSLASKLFVYLAAGLPVLVSSELAYMAELVEREGIGFAIAAHEVPRLCARLDACDYAALQANVARAQRRFIAEHTCDDVLALLEEVAP